MSGEPKTLTLTLEEALKRLDGMPVEFDSDRIEEWRVWKRKDERLTPNLGGVALAGSGVTWIQEARTAASGIILNAGAYTHTSVALLDALTAAELPVVEVHLSNIFRREPFRHHSYVSPAAFGVLCGFGPKGYVLALDGLHARLSAAARG